MKAIHYLIGVLLGAYSLFYVVAHTEPKIKKPVATNATQCNKPINKPLNDVQSKLDALLKNENSQKKR